MLSLLAVSITNTGLPQVDAGPNQIKTVLQLVFGIIGVVAVIYILLAGLKFVTSSGNPDQIAKARQSIIFAVVGLVIAVSAELIVTFVLGKL